MYYIICVLRVRKYVRFINVSNYRSVIKSLNFTVFVTICINCLLRDKINSIELRDLFC